MSLHFLLISLDRFKPKPPLGGVNKICYYFMVWALHPSVNSNLVSYLCYKGLAFKILPPIYNFVWTPLLAVGQQSARLSILSIRTVILVGLHLAKCSRSGSDFFMIFHEWMNVNLTDILTWKDSCYKQCNYFVLWFRKRKIKRRKKQQRKFSCMTNQQHQEKRKVIKLKLVKSCWILK